MKTEVTCWVDDFHDRSVQNLIYVQSGATRGFAGTTKETMRTLRNGVWSVVLLSILPLYAQENDSLGDVARRSRAQQRSNSTGVEATISQCSQGPVSEKQILAWQLTGMSAREVIEEIASRGTTAAIQPSSLPQDTVDPVIITAVANAPHFPSQAAESEAVLLPLSRAVQFFKQNDYRSAIVAMQDVIKQDQSSSDLFSALGNLFLKSQNLERAKQSYRRAVELAQNCAYAHGQLSSIYYQLEDTVNAEAEGRKMLALNPQSMEARKYLTRAHASRLQAEHEEIPSGDDVDSSEYENDKHERVPNEALHYNRAGIAKYQQGDAEGAIKEYRQAISAGPGWWAPYFNLGLAHSHLGRFGEAVTYYQQAKALSPERLNVRQNLGYCLCKLSQWNEAIAEFKEILEIEPTWNMARPCLYHALKAVHRDREAEQVYLDEQKYKTMGHED